MEHRDLYTGFIRLHILHHAAQEPIFGMGMIEELRHHGYQISPGTLYPMLHRLEKYGWLTCSTKEVNGKTRKYYRCTMEGINALNEAKIKLKELIGELL